MNIRHRRAVTDHANTVLQQTSDHRRIIFGYGLICCGLSLCSTLISVLLSDGISGTGGLSNIGLRSALSTGQSLLPLINLVVTGCLSVGYHICILCILRGFDANVNTLLSGFRHFGPVLRAMLFQGLVYVGVGFVAAYLSSFIFMATPFAQEFIDIMEPQLESLTAMDTEILLDDATLNAAFDAMIPMLWIMLAVGLVLIVPVFYRFRMVNFCIADDPRNGALYAISKSRRLMRRNCVALFRLDLHLWWFYAAQLVINLVCYGDVLLPMLGVSFPWSDTVSYYLFFVISLVMQMGLYCFGMNRVYTAYAVVYDALQEQLPKPELSAQM